MAKDKTDLAQWVELYTSELYSWAHHKVSDEEMARDLVQDTFMAAAEKLDSFREESTPKTWLFSILNFKIIDHYRNKVKKPISLEEQTLSTFFGDDSSWLKEKRPKVWNEDEDQLLDNEDFLEILKRCMDLLPDKWSSTLKLKYLLNKNGEEICQELEISTTNFWQIMHRARLNLRECIENNWFNN